MKRFIFLAVTCLTLCLSSHLYGENNKPVNDAGEKKVNEIKAKTAETEKTIKEKEDTAAGVKEKMEKISVEKETLTKELQIKEEAAAAAKKELESIKQEAAASGSPDLKRQARDLASQIKELENETAVYKQKLKISDVKAALAEKELAGRQITIDSLKQELLDLKYKRASLRGVPEKLFESLIIILASIVVFFVVKFGIKGVETIIEKRKNKLRDREIAIRIKTLGKILCWLLTIGIIATAVYMILGAFGISVAPLLAGAGIVGLAFGFGGQYLIRDVINGFFILLEGQYRIDDVVKIGDYGGLVEDINLRITTLRDLEGRVIIIPNGEIKTVVNFTKEYAQALFDIRIAYKENVDKVMDVIKEAGKELKKDGYFGNLILDDLEMLGVDDFSDSAVIIKFRIKTLPIKQWEVSREFRRRLKNKFDELGIEIPFPHMKVYWPEAPGQIKAARKA